MLPCWVHVCDRVLLYTSGWSQIGAPLASAFQMLGITKICHHVKILIWNVLTFTYNTVLGYSKVPNAKSLISPEEKHKLNQQIYLIIWPKKTEQLELNFLFLTLTCSANTNKSPNQNTIKHLKWYLTYKYKLQRHTHLSHFKFYLILYLIFFPIPASHWDFHVLNVTTETQTPWGMSILKINIFIYKIRPSHIP